MPDFNVRSDSVNVEQIMEQIRARIREKRGVDYTEQQIRDLAAVKLEKFLDPKGVRSDLLEQYRKLRPAYDPAELPNYEFEAETIYETHRGPLRFIRRLLNPLLKLFFNPNKLIQALHIQARLNTIHADQETARRATEQLTYELIHNLVVETTRLGIEAKNLKMRAESLASRLEFNERRARALESVVVYKPDEAEAPVSQRPAPTHVSTPAARPAPAPASISPSQPGPSAGAPAQEGPGQRSRRRRRRRGRRGGGPAAAIMAGQPSPAQLQQSAPDESEPANHDMADEAPDENGTATEDPAQVGGAASRPSEPVTQSTDGDAAQGPSKTDPDTQ